MKEVKDIFPDYHDGEFLAPKSGAKLASLFDLDQAQSQGNESFQFTAPKQPKKTSMATGPPPQKPAPSPTALAVLFATGAHTFRFVNGQYVKQGKLGAAVLGNHTTKEYTLLLYGGQQKHITTARIYSGFALTVQPGNYTTFYDDQRQNWSLKFDTEKTRLDFCKEVCLARWNSQACVDTLVVQDLLQGEGQAVGVGDTVEVIFTGWLLQNHTIGQMFDSNLGKNKLHRVRLGSGKAQKDWEEGMVGMQKGGRRLLIVPPGISVSKGFPNCGPFSSTLVFDVEVHEVSFSKDGDCLDGGSTDSHSAAPVSVLDSSSTDHSAVCVSSDQGDRESWVMTGSPNEPPNNSDAAKAKLISRMAKMGQPMLPFLKGAISAQQDPSDSETENISEPGTGSDSSPPVVNSSSSSQAVQVASKPPPCAVFSKPLLQHPETSTACFPQQTDISSGQAIQQPYATSHLQPFASVPPLQHMPYTAVDLSSFLMTEARQHNTEVRLAVGRVADRVDQLASKVEDLQKQGFCPFGVPAVSLETAMILHNIQRIVQENASLKKEVLEKGSKVEEQNRKIGELIEERQRYMEQSSLLMEQRNDALQNSSQHNHARLLQAEREKVRLAEELSSSSARVCELQDEAVRHQQRAAELQTKLSAALEEGRSCCALISSLQARVEELKNEGAQSQQQWRTEKQACRKMELTMKIMEEEIHDLRAEKEALDQRLSDRKRKWKLEREHLLMEQEEQRRSSEEEIQQLRGQLRRARACTETLTREQLQAELELEWQERCDAAVQKQKVKLEEVITQLQEQFTILQGKAERYQQPLEDQLAVQVKRVMNELFRSLRVQFDMQMFYTGDSVLKTLLKTIKRVTMHLLKEPQEVESEADDGDGEEEEEYLSTEETEKEDSVEKCGLKLQKEDHLQVSQDQTYMTADETTHLESSELTRYSSAASVLDGQPLDTHSEGSEEENDTGYGQSELRTHPSTRTKAEDSCFGDGNGEGVAPSVTQPQLTEAPNTFS